MCNRAVEGYGISTVALSLNREITEKVKAPRSLSLRFPYGAPLGEPGHINMQRAILKDMFDVLISASEPGTIIDLPYRWRRESFGPVDFKRRRPEDL